MKCPTTVDSTAFRIRRLIRRGDILRRWYVLCLFLSVFFLILRIVVDNRCRSGNVQHTSGATRNIVPMVWRMLPERMIIRFVIIGGKVCFLLVLF